MTPPVAEPEKKYLEDWEREVVNFLERYHAVSGVLPNDLNVVLDYVNSLKPHWNYTEEDLVKLHSDELFNASMRKRGIYIKELKENPQHLTPRQIGAAAVMMNVLDRRSDEKKLRDMGITTEEWTTWMQNKSFAKYLAARSELLIENSQHEAHLALVRGVRAGNISAVKYFNEMTGRFTEKANDQNVDMRVMISRILEVIQKHVKDPDVLGALGADMGQILFEANSQSSPNSVKGELL